MKKGLILFLILIGTVLILVNIYLYKSVSPYDRTVYLMVHEGESLSNIMDRADSLNLSLSGLVAKSYMRIYGADKKIVPGRYAVKENTSRLDLLRRIKNGSIDYVWITIPEGLTVNKTIEILSLRSGRPAIEFIRLANDQAFLANLPLAPDNLEGYLFPETYKVPYFAEPEYLIQTIVGELDKFLTDERIARAGEAGFDINELLTFASLIEAETADPGEMPIISSVFHNRLDRNMKLQCDPTVIYALGGLDRPLYRKDLKYDSPYNTYVYKGLPPGPINSPGKAAIMAALYPDDTDYLFFVADITGQHIFTETNAQHNRAREEIKRKRRMFND